MRACQGLGTYGGLFAERFGKSAGLVDNAEDEIDALLRRQIARRDGGEERFRDGGLQPDGRARRALERYDGEVLCQKLTVGIGTTAHGEVEALTHEEESGGRRHGVSADGAGARRGAVRDVVEGGVEEVGGQPFDERMSTG
jgi:hypothetical protein